ncbi:class I SAM-dependent methyltransferase [Roseitranquillus sediminis]|uniref:class I SAM-dependent methyltransferase n=1 Tax=Roseitranquillus sediminis TaxID=2809051 RepID=UPI001D0C7877|nr:class I SAM-dependent methyltransferase [Roseitranquillus sediminis]MBM9593063.1 methyltransferase domain-containing protein [Roseitranquillus sediminis]
MTPEDAFFMIHDGLPREGPGEAADVAWAVDAAGTPAGARICDAGCGPGGDLEALLTAVPEGHVTAVDLHPDFVEAVAARRLDRVDARQGDMAQLSGPYDLIWSAGALYFLDVTDGLVAWRDALAEGGAVAFSQLCYLVPNPPDEVRTFWQRYPAMTDVAGVAGQVEAAGYETLATRVLSDAAWEAYYRPLEEQIAALRPGASAELAAVLDEEAVEIDLWRRHRRSFGYLLSVVRPA